METLGVRAGSLLGGRYRLGEVVGSGSSAVVYRGHDEILDRAVAVKVLSRGLLEPVGSRERAEVALLASVAHHGLVTLFDADVEEASTPSFLVMELVDGPTLAARLAAGPIDPGDLRTLCADIAGALHSMHELGIIHRDVKPANILLAASPFPDEEFTAKLADFGVARLVDSARATATGTVIGTAAYLSPEQTIGRVPGPEADIYSLGLTVLEALVGRRTFPGTIEETLAARLGADPDIPDTLGSSWANLLRGMTEREQTERLTALQVVSALRSADWTSARAGVASDAQETQAMPPASSARRSAPVSAATTIAHQLSPDPAARSRGGLPRRAWIAVAIGLAVLVAAAAIVAVLAATATPAAPSLPSVGGTLGEHLRRLMQTVTP